MNYFTPFGVVGRKEYWLTSIVYFIAAFVGFCLMLSGTEAMVFAGLAIIIPFAYMGACLTIKRVRDSGCSGWFFIIYGFVGLIPYVGFLAQIVWMCLPTDFWDRYKSK